MQTAQAADVAAMAGVAWGNNNIGGHFAWGAMAHADVLPMINVGLYYEHFSNDITELPSGATFTNTFNTVAVDGNYKLTGLIDGAYVGAKAGIEIISDSRINTSNSTDFVIGPAIGYDYPLSNGFSIGGQLNVLFVTASPEITNTNLLAVLRYTLF